ncbi:d016ff59-97a4-4e2b-9e05-a91e23b87a92 [Sclerotinia trifoliorum]|uniref:D016ff59-97a4-4e2b-9e05-a91e23b87a92 n=1 Tax=Sclerotinia trifoliorum TaxID=28548 RepID=A0A8H2VYQ8_9HELO|nr:d016ff59-97a4-4e2b-9e05-a91e23b87a92 [Sclerotinia trifoliorum]
MEDSSAKGGTTPKISKHGKACVNCAKAKVKCVEKNGVGACERCHRLNKDCQPITRIERRKPVKKTTAAKTAELERKLDGLVSLLTAATQGQSTPSSTESDYAVSPAPQDIAQGFGYQAGSDFGNIPVRGLGAINVHPLSSIPIHSCLPGPAIGRPHRDPNGDHSSTQIPTESSPISLTPPELELSPTEEEKILCHFRTESIKYLPFIIIPPNTKVHEFKKENPFWWLAIVMTTSKNTSTQIKLGIHIRQVLSHRLIIMGERNLDLLWGLLTFIAWSQCHYHQRPAWSSLIQIAMGLVYDLGLNKAPPKETPGFMLNFDAGGCPKSAMRPTGSYQEKRALLCLYSLSSSFSLYFQRIDTLRWTPYAEASAKILSKDLEFSHDTLMVQIVRLQLIQERVKDAPWLDTAGDGNAAFKAPALFYLKALKSQMETFKQQIPDEVRGNDTFLLYLYNTELTIHEVALSTEAIIDMPDSQRLESLCICFQSVKSWFDLYFSLPCKDHISFTFPIYMHISHCMVALYRLSVFEDPQWDFHLVRQQLDLSQVLGKIVKTWGNVKNEAGLDVGATGTDDVDLYTSNAKKLALLKKWWDAKVVAETSSNASSEKFPSVNGNGSDNANGDGNVSTEPISQVQAQGLEFPTFSMDMGSEIWDDGWWQDAFGSCVSQGDHMSVAPQTHF